MEKETIIKEAYAHFSGFTKPSRCTAHNDDCPECKDHNDKLCEVSLASLTIEDIGSFAWSPVPRLNAEAMAYFFPRLIEFAVTNPPDCDGEPYVVRFINTVLDGPKGEQFSLLERRHKRLVLAALKYIEEHYTPVIENECWDEDLHRAIGRWLTS